MDWKEELFRNFTLYAVTDIRTPDLGILEKVEAACSGGVDIIQFRAKGLSDRELWELGRPMRAIVQNQRKLFIVNDRVDLALALEADGVHLGQEDMPVDAVRALIPAGHRPFWIGKSTHTPEQGAAAHQEDTDYLGVGPVFATPTKPGYTPAGLDYVRHAASRFTKPFVAIGGIDAGNLEQVRAAGARRIALVRAIFAAEDVYEAANRIKREFDACRL